MISGVINNARRLLIELGKTLPFVICFVVMVGYIECVYALINADYLSYDEFITLNTPISFWIASIAKYDCLVLFVLAIISVSIRACVWNKLAILYLAFQLAEKSYFADIELYIEQIYPIAIANIIACICLVHKGTQIMTKKQMNK